MAMYDIFNGDADGLCALQQLRLAEPCPEAILVTGTKRDIRLLDQVEAAAGDQLTVLDVSLDSNRAGLERALQAGARVRYFDHHYAGESLYVHPGLETHIDTDPATCTSLIVDRHLNGAHRLWAVTAAFGDNLAASARAAAQGLALAAGDLAALQQLGECLNYNGYGESLDDLWFHPAEMFAAIRPYVDPRQFMQESRAWTRLRDGYLADMEQAGRLQPRLATPAAAAFELPDAQWARRLSGILANQLATDRPDRAHALLTPARNDTYTVSVRAPLNRPTGADALCRQFPGGGGRAAAAGINGLPAAETDNFLAAFSAHFGVA